MQTLIDQLGTLTVGDIMTRDVLAISRSMSLRAAARLLSQVHVSGAPVVDENGACVGVISSTDFVRWANKTKAGSSPGNCVCMTTPWQMIEIEALPEELVTTYMTPDPVIVSSEMGLQELAKAMVDAHIHRVIVTDERKRPVGLVSSTDVIAALARAESKE